MTWVMGTDNANGTDYGTNHATDMAYGTDHRSVVMAYDTDHDAEYGTGRVNVMCLQETQNMTMILIMSDMGHGTDMFMI